MIERFLAAATIISCGLLVVLLHTTNPGEAGPAGMLAVFVLGYVSLLGVVTFLLYWAVKAVGFLMGAVLRRPLRMKLSLGRAYLYSSVLATLPMMAIGLYSTGGIAWHEAGLILLFGVIGVAYVARRTS